MHGARCSGIVRLINNDDSMRQGLSTFFTKACCSSSIQVTEHFAIDSGSNLVEEVLSVDKPFSFLQMRVLSAFLFSSGRNLKIIGE